MAQIEAFKGIRYNRKKIEDLSKVIAPPYDVISPVEVRAYYQAHPANIIRLILAQEKKGDTVSNNKYTRAGKDFRKWLDNKTLIQDEKPGLYVYQQKYKTGRLIKTRTGIFSLVRLEDFSKGIIFPHEETHSGPKKDRTRLIKNVKANLSPVFGLYDDPKLKVKKLLNPVLKKRALFKVQDHTGIEHCIWTITSPVLIKKMKTALKSKKIYIADGHHRYETALGYCKHNEKLLRKKRSLKGASDFQSIAGKPGYNYRMMCLVSLEDEGLIVLPTHRVLLKACCPKLTSAKNDDEIINKLTPYFDIKLLAKKSKQKIKNTQKQHCLLMYTHNKNLYLLSLRKKNILKIITPGKPAVYQNLDVNVLHGLIIKHLLGLKPREGQILYTRNEKEALDLVNKGKGGLSFILKAADINEVRGVALSGNKMPQKSTYFYPKLPTGLVINKL